MINIFSLTSPNGIIIFHGLQMRLLLEKKIKLISFCPGDSGSPLLNDEQSPDTLEIITTQIGVLHGGFVPCSDRDYPGIYALLTEPNMNKWLLDIVTGD